MRYIGESVVLLSIRGAGSLLIRNKPVITSG